MRWDFWMRRNKKTEQTRSPEVPSAMEQEGAKAFLLVWTAREIIGLQRLIGNQLVLRLLASHKSPAGKTSKR